MTTKSLNQAFLRAFSKVEVEVEVEEVPSDLSGSESAPTGPATPSSTAPAPNSQESSESSEPGEVTCQGELDSEETEGPLDHILPEPAAAGEILRIDGGTPSPTHRPTERMDGGDAENPETLFSEVRPVPSPHFVAPQALPLESATQDEPSDPCESDPSSTETSSAETCSTETCSTETCSTETGSSAEVEGEQQDEQQDHPLGDPDHSSSNDETTPDEFGETGNRATWIISDLGDHAQLLETMPLLVIPAGTEHDFSWPSDEVEVVDELPLCQQSGLRTSPLELMEESDGGSAEPLPEPSPEHGDGDEFVSAWEVDHVGWTSVCQQLYDAETEPFAQAGQQLFSATAEGLRVLAITSAYRGEGRTTMSLLLARSAAAAGVRVAVLDADLDNPQLALNARVQPASDWRRTLIDQSPLEEAAIHAVQEQITLFPLETQSRGEPLRLADPRVTKLIHDISAHFDLLIIDMGPIANDDRRLFAGGKACPLDAAVVVRDLRYTTDEQTSAVVRRLMDLGVEAVGVAENFIREAVNTVSDECSVTSRSA